MKKDDWEPEGDELPEDDALPVCGHAGHAGGRQRRSLPERLNQQQRRVLLCGLALGVLIGIFPPWLDGYKRPCGYAPIVAPPNQFGSSWDDPRKGAGIDLSRLMVQWIVLLILTAGALVWAGGDRKTKEEAVDRKQVLNDRGATQQTDAGGHDETRTEAVSRKRPHNDGDSAKQIDDDYDRYWKGRPTNDEGSA